MKFLRRHVWLVAALVALELLLFAPTIFRGRVLSANDILHEHYPWRVSAPESVPENIEVFDIPSGLLPYFAQLKRGAWSEALWDPYIGAGVPGWFGLNSGMWSPLVWLPVLLVPLSWCYAALVGVKLAAALAAMYAYLRSRALSGGAAAVGGLAYALAGSSVTWAMWHHGSAIATFPLVLWTIDRALAERGWRTTLFAGTAVFWALVAAGYPPLVFAIAYAGIAYALVRGWDRPRRLVAAAGSLAIAATLALALLAPQIGHFVEFLESSGYLGMRTRLAEGTVLFPQHLLLIANPFAFGSPRHGEYLDPTAMIGHNYVSVAPPAGLLTLALALVALAAWRRERAVVWAWGTTLFLVWELYLAPLHLRLFPRTPGLANSAADRPKVILALALAVLAGIGAEELLRRLRPLPSWPLWRLWPARLPAIAAGALVVLLVVELGRLPLAYYPYVEPRLAAIPETAGTRFLRRERARAPYRMAGLDTTFWPNCTILHELEDVRSHFSSEADYRFAMMQADPHAFYAYSTFLLLRGLSADLDHPLIDLLGVRHIAEAPGTRWLARGRMLRIHDAPTRGRHLDDVRGRGPIVQTLAISGVPRALELRLTTFGRRAQGAFRARVGAAGQVLLEEDVQVDRAAGSGDQLVRLDLPGAALPESTLTLELDHFRVPRELSFRITENGAAIPFGELRHRGATLDADLALRIDYGVLRTVYEGPDLRIAENPEALPRFRAVRSVIGGGMGTLIHGIRSVDFRHQAIVEDGDVGAVESHLRARTVAAQQHNGPDRLETLADRPLEQSSRVHLRRPALVATNLKFRPSSWRVELDGQPARMLRVDGLFAGVLVPAGAHEVRFVYSLPFRWTLALPAMALGALAALGFAALRLRRTQNTTPSRS